MQRRTAHPSLTRRCEVSRRKRSVWRGRHGHIAKKLACPSDLVLGPFSTVASAKRGETKIMRPYMEFNGKKFLQPDCKAAGKTTKGDLGQALRRSQKRGRRRRTVHTKLALQQEQEEHGRIMNICEEVN